MTNKIAIKTTEQKHQLYKSIWKKLSTEGKENISAKAQLSISYCIFIATSSGLPKGVPASTIYDLSEFASDEFEKEFISLKKQIKKQKK